MAMIESGLAPAEISTAFEHELRNAPSTVFEALVTLDPTQLELAASEFSQNHLLVGRYFPDFGVAYVGGAGAGLLQLLDSPAVKYVGPNSKIQFDSETGTVATRAREVWDAKTTSTTPVELSDGTPVTGAGVGVVVIDTGFDGTHPDLDGAMDANMKYVCSNVLLPTADSSCSGNSSLFDNWGCGGDPNGLLGEGPSWTSMPNTDEGDSHGTHVAGIVAGRGVASSGRIMGAAPGARLWGLSIGPAGTLIHALEAFNWVSCFNDGTNIRVVSNSWSIADAYSSNHPMVIATNSLVSQGLVVVFSAGNGGAGGTVSSLARNPTAGVLSVANYDDLATGSRTGTISSTSSACTTAQLARECPDISAPGVSVVSTYSKTGAKKATGVPLMYAPYYTAISGTSMAAPHVAGIVALLRQAKTTLTPADVEFVLEQTAIPFANGGPYSKLDSSGVGFLSIKAGHGLVDAVAALEHSDVLATSGLGSDLAQVKTNPQVYIADLVNPMVTSGAPPEHQTTYVVPAEVPVTLSERELISGGSDWPLSVGQDCRYKVFVPIFLAWFNEYELYDCADGGLITDGAGFEADATVTFQDTMLTQHDDETYTVEAQVYYDSVGWKSIDAFQLLVEY